MWGLFLGMLIGWLQIFAVNKLGRMMIDGRPSEKVIGVSLFLLKMAAIVVVLYLISSISLEHLVWTAGGILLGLLSASFYMLIRRRRVNSEPPNNKAFNGNDAAARNINGEDNSDG